MKEKLDYLLKSKGLSSSTFARMLEIQPSGISHILSGRNKPSFDLVVKILNVFPDVNPDWLLLGKGEMTRGSGSVSTPTPEEEHSDSSSDVSLFDLPKNNDFSEAYSEQKNVDDAIFSSPQTGGKKPHRIIVLYADGSFESFTASGISK